MPPKPSSTKQTSLLGFFGKAGQPPPARNVAAGSSQAKNGSAKILSAGASQSVVNGTNGSALSSKSGAVSGSKAIAVDIDDDDLSDAPSLDAPATALRSLAGPDSSPTKDSPALTQQTSTVVPELSPPPSKRSSAASSKKRVPAGGDIQRRTSSRIQDSEDEDVDDEKTGNVTVEDGMEMDQDEATADVDMEGGRRLSVSLHRSKWRIASG